MKYYDFDAGKAAVKKMIEDVSLENIYCINWKGKFRLLYKCEI